MIRARTLLSVLLRRSLGPRGGAVLGVAGLATGAVAGHLTYGTVGPAVSWGSDLVGGMLRDFPGTARLGIGLAFAFRTASEASADAQRGWTQQVLAAGATRENYLLGLIAANAAAAALLVLTSTFAWAAVLMLQGGGPAGTHLVLQGLPVTLLWIVAACSFAGAAIAITTRAATAQALMATLLVLPLAIMMSRGVANAADPPAWVRVLFVLRIPFADPSLRGVSRLLLFIGGTCFIAVFLAHRLLRLRQ